MQLDLEFPVFSTSAISVDHGYHLYAGLSRALDSVHSENGIAVHPIRGRQIGDRMLQIMPWSTVKIRTPQERIGRSKDFRTPRRLLKPSDDSSTHWN